MASKSALICLVILQLWAYSSGRVMKRQTDLSVTMMDLLRKSEEDFASVDDVYGANCQTDLGEEGTCGYLSDLQCQAFSERVTEDMLNRDQKRRRNNNNNNNNRRRNNNRNRNNRNKRMAKKNKNKRRNNSRRSFIRELQKRICAFDGIDVTICCTANDGITVRNTPVIVQLDEEPDQRRNNDGGGQDSVVRLGHFLGDDDDEFRTLCVGTAVAETFVLTSASCVRDDNAFPETRIDSALFLEESFDVIRILKAGDLAILQLDDSVAGELIPLEMADESPKSGRKVTLIRFFEDSEEGHLEQNGNAVDSCQSGDRSNIICARFDVLHESELRTMISRGSPALDEDGKLVGLLFKQDDVQEDIVQLTSVSDEKNFILGEIN